MLAYHDINRLQSTSPQSLKCISIQCVDEVARKAYPKKDGFVKFWNLERILQFDPTGTGTTSYAEGDANLDEELALEVQSKSGLAVTGDDLEYSSGEK